MGRAPATNWGNRIWEQPFIGARSFGSRLLEVRSDVGKCWASLQSQSACISSRKYHHTILAMLAPIVKNTEHLFSSGKYVTLARTRSCPVPSILPRVAHASKCSLRKKDRRSGPIQRSHGMADARIRRRKSAPLRPIADEASYAETRIPIDRPSLGQIPQFIALQPLKVFLLQ